MSNFHLLSGVPQGLVLDLVLFLTFICDISRNLKSDFLIYVDDIKITKKIRNVLDVISQREDLRKLHRLGKTNRMSYKHGQTKVWQKKQFISLEKQILLKRRSLPKIWVF